MASVSGATSSIMSRLSSKRITGLASGLDTDELVESMTAATRAKIAKAYQNKQKTQWKMDAYRSISSKIISLQNKFTSYSSSTNLRSPSFYSKSIITPSGEFSKYVKATGSGENLAGISIAGVQQLAKKTSYVSAGKVSESTLSGSDISADMSIDISKLAGKSFNFKYNKDTYRITLDSTKDFATMDEVVEDINKQLSKLDYGADGKKMNDILKATALKDEESGKTTLQFGFASDEVANIGNTLEITDVSKEVESILGLKKGSKASISGDSVISGKETTDDAIAKSVETKHLQEMLGDKEFTFTYNGKIGKVVMPPAEELVDEDGNFDMDKFQKTMQSQLDKEFGSGRVTVEMLEGSEDGKSRLSFRTTLPQTGPDGKRLDDNNSVFSLSGGNSQVLKVLGFKSGAANRLNLNSSIGDSGLNMHKDKNGSDAIEDYSIRIKDNITGEIHVIDKTTDGVKFSADTSVGDIMRAINASDCGVKVSYLSTSDQFSLTSTQEGASGDFSIVGTEEETYDGTVERWNLGQAVFGNVGSDEAADEYKATKGQDAIIWVDFDGDGAGEPQAITRSSNTFDLNGVSVTVTNTFNWNDEKVNEDGSVTPAGLVPETEREDVTFEAKADVDKITNAVKEMIEAYNEIVELSNKLVSEKPNRDYAPLTDEQKAEMSEEDIKNWNEKAKAGTLFNNSELRGFTTEIRFLFEADSAQISELKAMGITSSSSYSNNGKITFDEATFRNAVETNIDGVRDMFSATEEFHYETRVNSKGEEYQHKVVTKRAGIVGNMKTVFDKYAAVDNATKGIFVQAAGAEESPLSMLNNNLQSQMDEFDDLIKNLEDKLEDEVEKYYNKFASLEVYINNMNSQSSWLMQQQSM